MTSPTDSTGRAREFRWLRWPGLALAVFGIAMILVSPQLAGHKAFSAYVECKKDSFTPAHLCFAGSSPAYAALTDHRRDGTPYMLCVVDQDGVRVCRPGKSGTADESRFQSAGVKAPGRYDVSWYVRGRQVKRWRFVIYSRPATH
jgi:hypothetical protein